MEGSTISLIPVSSKGIKIFVKTRRYATKGKGDAALATGIIGTVGTGLGLLAGGNGLF